MKWHDFCVSFNNIILWNPLKNDAFNLWLSKAVQIVWHQDLIGQCGLQTGIRSKSFNSSTNAVARTFTVSRCIEVPLGFKFEVSFMVDEICMWRRYCCLTRFFPIGNACLSSDDMTQQSCAMLHRWRFLASFLRPVFLASRVPHISDMHSKFALRPHHVWKYGKHPISGHVKWSE